MLKKIAWTPTLFLILTPLAALVLTIYFFSYGQLEAWHGVLLGTSYILTTLSITGGYHRLLSHRAYKANQIVKAFYLLVGAGAFQNSALKWCSDHRVHHRFVDKDKDPYSIQKGFWYAHITWMFLKEEQDNIKRYGRDLQKDWMVAFQHKHYVPLAIAMGFGLPTLIGWGLGSAFEGLLFGGFIRLVTSHHTTFFINSLCHTIGRRPFTDENSGKDSLLMAFLAQGEGYHNFHHKFHNDYRNGFRWYHWDPTKWFVKGLSYIGWTYDLRKTPTSEILSAKMRMDQKRIAQQGSRVSEEMLENLRIKVEQTQLKWEGLKRDYKALKKQMAGQGAQKLADLRLEMKLAKLEFKKNYSMWRLYASAGSISS